MGAGVSFRTKAREDGVNKTALNKTVSNPRALNNLSAAEKESEESVNLIDMTMPSVVAKAEENSNILKRHLSEGILASKEAVTSCVELLKFSCSMDEEEEIKTAALSFVIENDIPGLIFQVYKALLTKYPDLLNYDREKDKVGEYNLFMYFIKIEHYMAAWRYEVEKDFTRLLLLHVKYFSMFAEKFHISAWL